MAAPIEPAAAAADALAGTDGPILDPIDRVSEILFGLFMVLTFTGTLSVATAGRDDVRTMLIAAIGCNTAWGFVDAVMFVLRNLVGRGRRATLLEVVRSADAGQARRAIADHVGPLSAGIDAAGLERLRQWLVAQPAHELPRTTVTGQDLKAACAVFLLVFASTFPVVLPFVFASDLGFAMRLSAAIAVAMMFYCGVVWGRYAGMKPWIAALALALLGVVVEAVVIALGG
ncbi:MAG TPA: hypothetical protein VFZ28_18470 [Burkholderiaceae bacterium]|nr:hypothetical protein [Burkholderiaceae bacterium]